MRGQRSRTFLFFFKLRTLFGGPFLRSLLLGLELHPDGFQFPAHRLLRTRHLLGDAGLGFKPASSEARGQRGEQLNKRWHEAGEEQTEGSTSWRPVTHADDRRPTSAEKDKHVSAKDIPRELGCKSAFGILGGTDQLVAQLR